MSADKKVVIIGAGFSGLATAAVLADKGFNVHVLEKHADVGGRARVLRKDGFVFDRGPSWYWMPEIIEQFFNRFGKSTADFFELKRLNPSYQVIFGKENVVSVPADFSELQQVFESKEVGSGEKLKLFLQEAQGKYKTGMADLLQNPPCHGANLQISAC